MFLNLFGIIHAFELKNDEVVQTTDIFIIYHGTTNDHIVI